MKHQTKSCGVIVFRNKPCRSFLLMKHPDRYDLPKGHVDSGETEIECAMRELEEETGIKDCDIEIDPDFLFRSNYPVRYERLGGELANKTLVIFLGRLHRDVTVKLTEHDDFEWHAWQPPHHIQQQTIDPLLQAVAEFFNQGRSAED